MKINNYLYLACQVIILLVYVHCLECAKKIAEYLTFETVGKLGVVFKHKVYRKMLALLDFVLVRYLTSLLKIKT